ncbi:MAG: tetratricopeptide repeat protein [Bacteroidia bacterium]|jgi:serine phosphatase RsbU (regulator of sigma subunit)/Tfp pilus assembly protein PilF|nr:tetratricopeptide repeat protein [Bacteroidia bacterium]
MPSVNRFPFRVQIRVLLLVLFPLAAAAQKTDSLERLIAGNAPDTVRMEAWVQLVRALSVSDAKLTASKGRQAIEFARQTGDEKREAWVLNYMGGAYYYASRYDSSLYYHEQALTIRKRIDDWKGLGASYNNIGQIYDDQGRKEIALDYYLRSLDYMKKTNYQRGLGIVYNSLGNLYYYQKDYNKSLFYFSQGLTLSEAADDDFGRMNSYNNIGLIWKEMGDAAKALMYYRQGLQIAIKNDYTTNMPTMYNNIGEIYMERGKNDSALFCFRKAYTIASETDDEVNMVSPLGNMGTLLHKTGRSDTAEVCFQRALQLSRKNELLDYQQGILSRLANLNASNGNFEKAYFYQQSYDSVSQLLFNRQREEQMQNMQVRYDTEAIKKESQLTRERLAQSERERWYLAAVALAVLLAAVAAVFAWLRTRKLNKKLDAQHNNILRINNDLETQREIIATQNRELTDSINYAQRIQQALLPDAAEVKRLLPHGFVFFRPRDIVSGDFYYLAGSPDDCYIVVADCTGHGVPGALMSMIGMEELITHLRPGRAPGEILGDINRAVRSLLKQNNTETGAQDGMDIAICRYQPAHQLVEFAGAHRPLWIVHQQEIIELKPTKASIGGFTPDDQEFATTRFTLQPGMKAYLFSDGIVDQFGGSEGKKLMNKRLREMLVEISSLAPDQRHTQLANSITEWQQQYAQVDDMLMIGF